MKLILILIITYLALSSLTALLGSKLMNQPFKKNILKHLLFWFTFFVVMTFISVGIFGIIKLFII